MKSITVGLLPLYIALYDEADPGMRPGVEAFYELIAAELEKRGLTVLRAGVCRLNSEFKAAINAFEAGGAQALVTLHLAYSPSLESERALAGTRLPVVVLDTTPDWRFDWTEEAGLISYNHGIHGVQDMCNLLLRNGKAFEVVAGHWEKSDVIDRAANAARVAAAASALGNSRVGLIGEPFAGMGDFRISPERFARLGVEVVACDLEAQAKRLTAISQELLDEEYRVDADAYDLTSVDRAEYDPTERVGQAVRAWIAEERLTAFSMNFLAAGSSGGFPTMPFPEACKAMARGIGYAGEGDALTAALVGALLTAWPDATFAEMFCPNWAEDTLYFSHMGEFNLNVCDGKPRMIHPPFPYAPCFAPTRLVGHFRGGEVCLVNLAPGADDLSLVIAPGRMVSLPKDIGAFAGEVSGWFKPALPLSEFLPAYSRLGGTHHSALVYGATVDQMRLFARFLGLQAHVIA